MEETQEYDTEELERCIIKIIEKIKNNRNRPCFQNILTLINRGGINLDMENLKNILNVLIEKKIICDKGKEGHESFCLLDNEHESIILEDEVCNENTMINDPVEEYINIKFYEILINKIKEEVKNTVDTELKKHMLLSKNTNDLRTINANETTEMDKSVNGVLIEALRSEIVFLRNEMSSKDTIIKLLINDRDNDIKNIKSANVVKETRDNNYNATYNKNNNSVEKNNSFKKNNSVYKEFECNVRNDAKNRIGENIKPNDVANLELGTSKKSKKRSITIIGDSLLKDVKAFKMRKDLPNEKVYVKSFPGSTTNCMKDYVKPSLKYDPDLIIMHVGTNDLRSEKTPLQIADDIIRLALEMKTDVNDVTISGIISRNDDLNDKGLMVNDFLKIKTSELSLGFLENKNIKPGIHLNNVGLHLNGKGTFTFANNLLNFIRM